MMTSCSVRTLLKRQAGVANDDLAACCAGLKMREVPRVARDAFDFRIDLVEDPSLDRVEPTLPGVPVPRPTAPPESSVPAGRVRGPARSDCIRMVVGQRFRRLEILPSMNSGPGEEGTTCGRHRRSHDTQRRRSGDAYATFTNPRLPTPIDSASITTTVRPRRCRSREMLKQTITAASSRPHAMKAVRYQRPAISR